MSLLVNVFNFFLVFVVAGMAYIEYRETKNRMFLFLATGFAFLGVGHLSRVVDFTQFLGELPLIAISTIGYLVIIYGTYSQSKIYKIIR